MKIYKLIITLLLMTPLIACTAQPAEKEINSFSERSDKIDVYYFHYSMRCG